MKATSIKNQITNMKTRLAISFALATDDVCRFHAVKEYEENQRFIVFSEQLIEKKISSRDSRLKFNCVYFNDAATLQVYDYIESLEQSLDGYTVQLTEINVKDDYIKFKVY